MFSSILSPDAEMHMLTPRHARQLFALVDRNREYLRQWLTWVDGTVTVADSRENRKRSLERYTSNGCFEAGIWYKGELAGVIGLHQIDWTNRNTAIGYWLGEEFQGKGLMTMACKSLLMYSFEGLTLNRIEIRAATQNTRSRAIPERLGFKHEGTSRQSQWLYDKYVDMEVYSMLLEDWLVRKWEAEKVDSEQ